MPAKPHLDLKILMCYEDVGGADAWLGSWWGPNAQWWVGWHMPGPSGLQGLRGWSWPDGTWHLIGFELWEYRRGRRRGDVLIEAYYNCPNPSTLRNAPAPTGHYHVKFPKGKGKGSWQWFPNALDEGELYLKGSTGPKGKGTGCKGKGKGKAEGKGKGPDAKGKGKGSWQWFPNALDEGELYLKGGTGPKGKGTGCQGKGTVKGKAEGKGKGLDAKGKGKGVDAKGGESKGLNAKGGKGKGLDSKGGNGKGI